MIDTIVIIVFDRLPNLVKWFYILDQCQVSAQVVVIHNTEGGLPVTEYQELCIKNKAIYISRNNIGFDIGAFQDVCKNRLQGFPEWQQLIWFTDDTFPMRKDFLNFFAIQQGEGARVMEISPFVREHIRTTGFSITKKIASVLTFPADPVITKQHCYMFEHRRQFGTFLQQLRAIGLRPKMVAPKETSPVFDFGYHRRQPRESEFNKTWGFTEKENTRTTQTVTIICPIYKSFPAVISSLIMQTYKDWRLLLIHDGPGGEDVASYIELINDDRITYIEKEIRVNNWGHSIRAETLQEVKSKYVLITNPDNYYTPVFLEYMLGPFNNDSTTVATFCSHMVHSYRAWNTQACALARGHVDCGGVLLKTKEAQEVGWHSTEHSADWFFFENIIKKFGSNKFKLVKGTLFVHN